MWMLAAFAYNQRSRTAGGVMLVPKGASAINWLLVSATALMIGLRFQVGGDWPAYLENYHEIQVLSYSQALGLFEAGYATFVFIAGRVDAGIWLSNLACGVVMTSGIARFCNCQPNPALSFLVAVPYLIIVVGMGYTRQGVAIGLIMAGLANADGRKLWKLVIYMLAATLFHRTALLVLPLALAPLFRRNILYAIMGGLTFFALFYLLLAESADLLVTNYVDANYESSGATVRVAMNLVPAILALLVRRRLGFNAYQKDVWIVFALASLGALALVVVATFSTAIDRMALFLIPLQVAILPRIPYIIGSSRKTNAYLVVAVCGYSALVQFVWLVFAVHARYWVPYQVYLINT